MKKECVHEYINHQKDDAGFCAECKHCGHVQNFEAGTFREMQDAIFEDDDDDLFDDDDDDLFPVDCPNCQRTYDDADADYLICHHCGFNANTGKVDRRKISGRNMLGLDADANDVWL